jgi:hypothetical protein
MSNDKNYDIQLMGVSFRAANLVIVSTYPLLRSLIFMIQFKGGTMIHIYLTQVHQVHKNSFFLTYIQQRMHAFGNTWLLF